MPQGKRTLYLKGDKEMMIDIPVDAEVTFGPWSPPGKKGEWNQESKRGTLRIYHGSKKNIIGCFTNVNEFRDISHVNYKEVVAREEGAVVWKSDRDGYQKEEKVQRQRAWVSAPALPEPNPRSKKSR